MAVEIAEHKKKTAYAQFGTALLKYVLGPVIVALGIGSYANTNHQQSAAGYEVLAKAMNHEIMDKLEAMEKRVVKLEARVALQPASAPATQPLIKSTKPPKLPVVAKAPEKAPAKATPAAKALPAAKAPIRVPAKMDLKMAPASMPVKLAPPAPKTAPKPMKRIPEQLYQIKR